MDLNSIKNRIDILELAEHLDIEVNSAHKARCPFHDDTDPSLTFWPDSNSFHCFGCNAGGDIFSLVMQKENLSFGDAVRYLCDFANIPIEDKNFKQVLYQSRKENGLNLAYNLYRNANNQRKLKHWATKRNISFEYLSNMGTVYIDGKTFSAQKNLSRPQWESLASAGIIYKNTYQKAKSQMFLNLGFIPQDIFSDSGVIFPIYNPESELTGLVFRSDSNNSHLPKYKYNQYFPKDNNLFGINKVWEAAKDFKKSNRGKQAVFDLFIVEGIMDTIRLQSIGFNASGIMGTNISFGKTRNKSSIQSKQINILEHLIKFLDNFTVRVHIFLDNDSAGVKGAKYAFLPFLDLINSLHNVFFDYVFFNEDKGKDPDEILQDNDFVASEKLIQQNLYSCLDFLVATELNVKVDELNDTWNNFHFWQISNAIKNITDPLKSKSNYYFESLFYCGLNVNEYKTDSEPAQKLFFELQHLKEKQLKTPDVNTELENVSWNKILEITQKSYSSLDFPIDLASWERIRKGLTVFKYFLKDQVSSDELIEPCIPALMPRKNGEAPRLLTLPSPEDLIIETAFLYELLQYGAMAPGLIPIVYDAGNGLVTNGNPDWTPEETVSFAYQLDLRDQQGVLSSHGLFKHFSECWNDFNNHLMKKARRLSKSGGKICCIRLDIHRYYDSISKDKIENLLRKIFKSNLLQQNLNILSSIVGQQKDSQFSKISRWIQNRLFGYPYLDPENGNHFSSVNPQQGIPQGPNLSAWIANALLFELDTRVVKECQTVNTLYGCEVTGYARYVDDMVIIAPDIKIAERLRRIVIDELQKKGLLLSTKTELEQINSQDDFYDMIRKNRGLKSTPYGGENIDFNNFDTQQIDWQVMAGDLDRKNMLSFIYSNEILTDAINSNRQDFIEHLHSVIYSSAEVRYRDYRRVVALLVYKRLCELEGNDSIAECIIDDWENVVGKIKRIDGTLSKNDLQLIDFLAPLFSIFEGLQQVLTARYDNSPLLTLNDKEKIAQCRKKVAKLTLATPFIDKIKDMILAKTDVKLTSFAFLIKTWKLALYSNASLAFSCNHDDSLCQVKDISEASLIRYALGANQKNTPPMPSADRSWPRRNTAHLTLEY